MRLDRTSSASLAAMAITALAALAFAGPLNPPTGPVQSTIKTLAEIEPRIAINATNTPLSGSGVLNTASNSMYASASY